MEKPTEFQEFTGRPAIHPRGQVVREVLPRALALDERRREGRLFADLVKVEPLGRPAGSVNVPWWSCQTAGRDANQGQRQRWRAILNLPGPGSVLRERTYQIRLRQIS